MQAEGAAPPRPRRKRRLFNNYQVGNQIAMGTCGPVYVCLNADTGEFIAMKEYNVDAASSPVAAKRMEALRHEIDLLRKSKHGNIVRYLGTEQREGRCRVFMEFVPAGTLHKLLQQFGAFNESVIKQYTKQMLSALGHMHAQGIVHGNVSTSHVLVSSAGTIKLSGLGAAWRTTADCVRTFAGDIWSLGATMVEMATARPFPLSCPDAGYHAGGEGGIPASSFAAVEAALPPELSPELAEFVLACLDPEFEKRPTAAALLAHPFLAAQASSDEPASLPTPLLVTRQEHIGSSSIARYRVPSRGPLSAAHAGSRLKRVNRIGEDAESAGSRSGAEEEFWEALGRQPSLNTHRTSSAGTTPNPEPDDELLSSGKSVETDGESSGSESGGEDQLGELEDMRIDRRVGGDRIGGVGPPQSRLTSFRTSEEAGDSVHGGRTFSNTLLGVNAFNGNESMGASMSLGNSLLGARATSTFRLPFNRKQLRGLGMSDSVVSVATVTETEKDPLVTSGGWQMFDPLLERNRLVGTGKEKEKRGVDKTGRTQHQHMFLANIQSTDHYRGDGDADGEEEEEERGDTQQPTPSPIAPLAPLACVSAAAGDVTTPSLSVTSTAITSPTSPPSLKAPLPSLKKDTSPQAIVHADSMPVHRSPFTGLKGLFKGSSNGRINPGDAGEAPVPVEEGKKTFMGGMLNRLSWGGKKTKPATVPPTPVTGPSATYSDESGSEGEEVQAPATKLFHRALPQSEVSFLPEHFGRMATPTRGLQTRLVREFLFGHRATGSKFTQLWEFMSKEHPGLVKSKSHFKNSVLKQMWTRGELKLQPVEGVGRKKGGLALKLRNRRVTRDSLKASGVPITTSNPFVPVAAAEKLA